MEDYVRDWLDKNDGKEIVVIYGNCHTTAIRHKLTQIEAFSEKYAVFPFDAIQDVKDPSYFDNGILDHCNLFIHQVIRDNNRYGIQWSSKEIIKKLKNNCSIIGIPNLYHLPVCFFQQFTEQKDFQRKGNTVFFRDSILDDAFHSKWSLEKTVDFYRTGSLGDEEKVKRDFESFINKVNSREKDWDIKISDFILNHYKYEKLFYDPNHPTPIIINEVSRRLLETLDIKITNLGSYKDYCLDLFEMPLCGYVKNSLGLDYEDNIIRNNGIKKIKGNMDLSEYITEYWAYEWQNNDVNWRRKINSFYHFIIESMAGKFL